MNCQRMRQAQLDRLGAPGADHPTREWAEHLRSCPRCAEFDQAMRRVVRALRPSRVVSAPPGFKAAVTARLVQLQKSEADAATAWARSRRFFLRPALVTGMAATILAVVLSLPRRVFYKWETGTVATLGLLSQALAAEGAVFSIGGIVHIVNEIVVPAIGDPDLARSRWFPLMAIESTGKPGLHQLLLPAEAGETYCVEDESWYEESTARFVRLLRVHGRAVFANSFDGEVVYFLSADESGAPRLVRRIQEQGFQPPRTPAEYLGMAAGFPFPTSHSLQDKISDLGSVELWDGSSARAVRLDILPEPEGDSREHYLICKVREKDNTMAEFEMRCGDESFLIARRLRTEASGEPEVGWDLGGLDVPEGGGPQSAVPHIVRDALVSDISMRDMVDKADFETYALDPPPAWTNAVRISDVLNLPDPPHRCYQLAYQAPDKRHVVLFQTGNQPEWAWPPRSRGQVIYASPTGNKLWSSSKSQWDARITLTSARASITDPAAEDCSGYFIETPSGMWIEMAINGRVSDDELRTLADHLRPARECLGK